MTSPQGVVTSLRRVDLEYTDEPKLKRMKGEGTHNEMDVDDCHVIPEARYRDRDQSQNEAGIRNLLTVDDFTLEERNVNDKDKETKMDIDENDSVNQ